MRTVQKKGGEPSHPLKGLMSEQRTGVVNAYPVKRFAKFLYRHPGAARVAHPAWLAARLRCPSVLLPGLLILSEQSRHLRSHSKQDATHWLLGSERYAVIWINVSMDA